MGENNNMSLATMYDTSVDHGASIGRGKFVPMSCAHPAGILCILVTMFLDYLPCIVQCTEERSAVGWHENTTVES